jgi:hypothetical protein
MRGLLALGAPLGVPEQVDQEEVQVAYRDIILRAREVADSRPSVLKRKKGLYKQRM